jgi:DNA-binding transcriptional regulator GbsR (MarR family)
MRYIRYVPNESNERLSEAERRFVEDVGRLMVPWGIPQITARLYGYLLLSAEPASLDRIAADLQVSKSSASVAARQLEAYTLVHRHGERGSRRALYAASDNYEGMLTGQNRYLQALAELLGEGARGATSGAARDRLEEMAEFYVLALEAMETVLRRWSERRRT